jgi:hypothetical protein
MEMEISRNLIGKICNIYVFDKYGKFSISAKVVSMNDDYILIENSHSYRSLHRKDHIIDIKICAGYYRNIGQMNDDQIINETL